MLLDIPQKRFSFNFKVPIWQIRPDFEQELLAIELRDGDRLQTEFILLDVKNGTCGTPYQSPENWWVGLEDTGWRMFFLHGFADRKVGAHVGITAIGADMPQILWQQNDAVFYGLAEGNKVLAQPNKTEKEVFISLDAHSGNILENAIPREQAYEAVAEFARVRAQQGFYPVPYPAESEYFTLLSQFVLMRTGRQVAGVIDYLEVNNFLILSYYEAAPGGKWKNLISLFAAETGALVWEEVLNNNLTGWGTNSFFVMKNTLIFITEKNTLVGYNL